MAKERSDCRTMELPGMPAPRGRPRSPNPLTPAQRAKRYRDRLKKEHHDIALRLHNLTDVTLARYSVHPDIPEPDQRLCWIELGRRKGWRKA